MRFHMEMSIEQKVTQGMDPVEATREAKKEFGSSLRMKEECRMSWGTRLVDETVQDVKRAARRLWKRPSYSVPVILILSIALGVCGVLSSIVSQRILHPMAYPDAHEIIELGMDHPSPEFRLRMTSTQFSIAEFYLESDDLFESIGFMNTEGRFIRHDQHTEFFYVCLMTPGMWEVMRLLPRYGRPFTQHDINEGRASLAVITYDYARKTFGTPEAAVGQSLRLNDELHEVIGVMGKGKYFPDNRPIAIPLTGLSELSNEEKTMKRVIVLSRLKDGVSLDQLTDRQTVILEQAKELHALTKRLVEHFDMHLRNGQRLELYRFSWEKLDFQQMLGIVSILALLLYFIACLNWLGVFRTHLIRHCRITGICFGLGAPRMRLLRSICMEVQLLFVVALIGSVLVALVLYDLVNRSTLFEYEPVLKDVGGFATMGILAVVGCAMSLPLIFRHLRISKIYQYLHERSSTTSVRSKGLFMLSVLQVFLGVVMVLVSGFLSLNIYRILTTDFGFSPKDRIVASLTLPDWNGNYTVERKLELISNVKQALERAPGFESVGLATDFPQCFLAFWTFGIRMEASDFPRAIERAVTRDDQVRLSIKPVDEDYARTMGMKLLRGRWLEKADGQTPEVEVVIDEVAAKELFSGEDPIGHAWSEEVRGRDGVKRDYFYRIVGVVETVDYNGNQLKVEYHNYQTFQMMEDLPHYMDQLPVFGLVGKLKEGRSVEAVEMIQKTVREIDPDVFVAIRFYEDAVRNQYRSMLQMSGVSIVLSLITVVIAGYGFISFLFYKTELMKKEFAIRLAMGARKSRMIRSYMVKQSIPVFVGTLLGIGVVACLIGQFENQLTDVSQFEVMPYALLIVGTVGFVGLSSLFPLWQMRKLEIRELLQGE